MEVIKDRGFSWIVFSTSICSEIKTVPGAEQVLRKSILNESHERRKKWMENVFPFTASLRDTLAFERAAVLIGVSI